MKKILIIILLFISCSNNTKNKRNIADCQEINPLEVTKEICNLDEYIDSIEIIDINKNKTYFDIENAKKIIVLENGDIIMLTKKITKFDGFGNYILTYGDYGKGNGEYLKIYDICLNSDKTEIWALDYTNCVIKYNLTTGKYIGTLKTDFQKGNIEGTCDGIIPSNNQEFYLLSLNKPNATKIDYEYPYLTAFDSKGEFNKNMLRWRDFNIDYPYSAYISYSSGKYIIRPQENDNICYIVENGELLPFLKIHFGAKNIKPLFAFNDGENPWLKLTEIVNSDDYKHIMNIQLTKKHLFFSTLRPASSQDNFLINIDSLSGIRWSHKDENSYPFFVIGSDDKSLYGVYTYFKNHNNISAEKSPLLNYIVKRVDKNREEESFLVKINFK